MLNTNCITITVIYIKIFGRSLDTLVLNKVREKLKVTDDTNIDCLIIYPDMENGIVDFSLNNIQQSKQKIKAYYKVYKLGISLPLINS